MRIFLLPLSTRQALIYCQKSARKTAAPSSYSERIQQKASETWARWEEAESGWKKTIVKYGNAGLQRIPYQEWGLKSFPPAAAKVQAEQLTDNKKFEVVYPGNVMRRDDIPKVLQRLAKERKQLHWNRFMGSMIAMPLTVPFALIPVIPNIPFFYATYRCWSHWRALKGSDYLEFIVENRMYRPTSTKQIEDLLEKIAPDSPDFTFVTAGQIEDGTAPPEKQILTSGSHTVVARTLGVPELSGEVERAVWQVGNALRKSDASKQQTAQQQPSAEREKNAQQGKGP